jgi:two-component system LytT family sensor kinase
MFQFLSRYWLYASAGCLLWTAAHFYLLHTSGFSDNISITDALTTGILLLFFCLGLITIVQFYYPRKKRAQYLSGLIGVFTLIWWLAYKSLLPVFIKDAGFEKFVVHTLLVRVIIGFTIIGCAALIAVLLNHQKEHKEALSRAGETKQLAKEAELFNLRQQLQPHFLFNSLNSINALIGMDPEQAREMVHRLSLFLRGTLHKDERKLITFREETDHLQLYLDMEKLRFGHRLSTRFMIDADTYSLRLPPLLLQPVVENAIKFALYGTIEEVTIGLAAIKEERGLKITVTNPFDTETVPASGTGFGLRSVYRRLYLLFARTDLLHTATEGNIFTTTIIIPQHDQSYSD